MFKSLLFSILLTFLFACKDNPQKETSPSNTDSESVLSVEIPEGFVAFYNKFHSDSIFQMNHIVFPLAVKDDGSKWQKENWKLHKAFNDQNGAYQRTFENFNGIIFETIVEKTGAFKILKRYSKSDKDYNLIYYSSEVTLKGWEEDK